MLRSAAAGLALCLGALVSAQPAAKPVGVTFRVKIAADQVGKTPESGRVLVGIGPANSEPDFINYRPPVLPILGADVEAFAADTTVTLDATSDAFPLGGLEKFPAGEYTVQARFLTNRDINLPDAPGNRYSKTQKVKLDPAAGTTVTLTLDAGLGQSEVLPRETAAHKYHSVPSKLLSVFHGRPMVYRVGVVLPPNFDKEPEKRYGLVVAIGGFGTRYTSAKGTEPDPRFVQIVPDGAGPFGDPYQVDSANNGPYGAALTTEVIPFIEKTYRCVGTPRSRFTTGGSTGGWVSLALQLFYPDFFNGCWSQCPDSLTFERFELIDLYADANAYTNRFGIERPATRTVDGDTVATVRHECQLERVLGRGGRWELGGRDWASWNATYGPKGKDGRPVPVWDGRTGAIDRAVLDHWKKFDLLLVTKNNWKVLGPKLAGGKVNVWVGDADEYFLNAAVRRFKDATGALKNPKFDGTVMIEARKGHESGGWTRGEILDAMAARMK
ncbi:alpha/beta hydrolase-fold protein [Gemmata sp.]|uniref:alpha/beta hydrolase-fold protein n=1 Tax=Gemmata sp. TaxID=1914242 RepID=UPI003F73024A